MSFYEAGTTYSYTEALLLLIGLKNRQHSRFTTKKTNRIRPQTEESTLLLEVLDGYRAVHHDSKRSGPYKPLPRAYHTDAENGILKGSLMTTEEAKEAYKLVITKKTDDEIRAANREWIKKHKLKG